jgi:uncharacterized protein (TIGR02996 family)
MSVESSFLEDILDNPDDDTPRLIYADWLSDRAEPGDDARAELIRALCQIASLDANDPAVSRHRLRVHHLLGQHERNWLPADLHSPRQGEWRRGFFCVQTRLWPFLCWGAQWFAWPAVLQASVDIRGSGDGGILNLDEEHVRFLGQTPILDRVTQMNVRGRPHPERPWQGDDVARAVAGSPDARRLRRLELSCLSDEGARALLESPYLGSLKSVVLYAHTQLSGPVQRELEARFRTTG